MSIASLNWAFEQRLPPPLKAVLVALAHRHNAKTGQINPSVETLAIMTGLSERGVQRALRDLEQRKLIRPTGGVKGGRGKSTRWALVTAKGRTPVTLSDPLKGDKSTGFRKSLKGDRVSPDKEEGSYRREGSASGERFSAEKYSDEFDGAPSPSPLRLVAGGRP